VTWYELFLFVHVATATVWVGGGAVLQVLALRVLPSNDPVRMAGFAGDAELLGMRVFTPASLLLILSAIGLMLNDASPWEWSEPFVSVGLVVWVISFLAGVLYLGPTSGKIKKSIEATGPTSPESVRLIANILRYSRIELALLVITIFMMTVKLGT
jgi:uncharacterized membrane protein